MKVNYVTFQLGEFLFENSADKLYQIQLMSLQYASSTSRDFYRIFLLVLVIIFGLSLDSKGGEKPVRIFIFAGQSNMVGSDSKVRDIDNFPPFEGLGNPQQEVLFNYILGRENKTSSEGWTTLKPVNNIVGPELSFARELTRYTEGNIGIIKIAAGGTHLGGDWNPDHPTGFKLFPLALSRVKQALQQLEEQNIQYQLEGFMWHQGENDMFNRAYMNNYRANLKNFIKRWREELNSPSLHFYIGELCTKTIWGMDLRPRMFTISLAQKQVSSEDPLTEYVPTSHVGVEIGNPVGLHYHYGTLGQLQHGINYAHSYFRVIGKDISQKRNPAKWPLNKDEPIKLFVLAGHRNMEGERAFVKFLNQSDKSHISKNNDSILYKYSLGGGYKAADKWEHMGVVDYYETFGPELSFSHKLQNAGVKNIAILKFTHSGSQIIDWTPDGSGAPTRNLFFPFTESIKKATAELSGNGYQVSLEGIFYHIGENDMSYTPFRRDAAKNIQQMIQGSRKELDAPELKWFISQQPPTNHKNVNGFDVTSAIDGIIGNDENAIHVKAFDLPVQEKRLVIDTPGIVMLGEILADAYLSN